MEKKGEETRTMEMKRKRLDGTCLTRLDLKLLLLKILLLETEVLMFLNLTLTTNLSFSLDI